MMPPGGCFGLVFFIMGLNGENFPVAELSKKSQISSKTSTRWHHSSAQFFGFSPAVIKKCMHGMELTFRLVQVHGRWEPYGISLCLDKSNNFPLDGRC